MKSLFCHCLLLVLYGMAVCLTREYIYVSQSLTWLSAQNYCRRHYSDLASITTEEENQRAVNATGQNSFQVWIGLNRTVSLAKTWEWSGGEEVNFTKWNFGKPDDESSGEFCAAITPDGWINADCKTNFPFICYSRLTLVKENKTWDEALRQCKTNYSYLAFMENKTLLDLLKIETEQTQTANMWTGLRFLDGKWFWANQGPLGNLVSLPSCPALPYHCGAYNFNKFIWENVDCNEKLNFLCYH